jgi:hypothetical protein
VQKYNPVYLLNAKYCSLSLSLALYSTIYDCFGIRNGESIIYVCTYTDRECVSLDLSCRIFESVIGSDFSLCLSPFCTWEYFWNFGFSLDHLVICFWLVSEGRMFLGQLEIVFNMENLWEQIIKF